jgi:hypothetical protein
MSYLSTEEPMLGSRLGCGPGCDCGPCQSGGRLAFFSMGEEQPAEAAPEAPVQELPPPEAGPPPEPAQPTTAPPDQRPSTPDTDADLQAIRSALSQGIRNPKRLTDLVFFARHPDRKGNPNWMNEPGLFDEWRQIRQELVLPEMHRSSRLRPPAPRVIYRTRRPMRSRLHGYPGFGYFAAPPVCDPSRRDLNAIADDLKLINNELARGAGASPHRMNLKRQLLDSDVDGMIHALDSYIASGCCEPSLKTLESEINALPWPLLVVPTKLRLAAGIVAAQGRARKDFTHC